MAQIMNINAAPVVSPEGAYLVALKDGRISRIKGDTISQAETKEYINQKIEEINNSYKEIIAKLENDIIELKAVINGMYAAAQTEEVSVEITEETDVSTKTKSKKSKK